ncbi:MAG: hypothetical protein WCY88_17090 [Spongiibacteraceae bacterium]
MTTITSTNINQSLINSDQANATQQTTAAETLPANETPAEPTTTQDTVEISTRAQKIQKLNDEFFFGDPRAVKITPELIDRLAEYGLISAKDAESLGGTKGTDSSAPAETIGELTRFIDSFTTTAERVDSEHSIINILQQAQTVLDNFNAPTAASLAVNIPSVSTQLHNYIDATAEQLPDSDVQNLKQLVSALGIANALTPGVNTTEEINNYLTVYNL